MKKPKLSFNTNPIPEHRRIKREIPGELIPNNNRVPPIIHYIWIGSMLDLNKIKHIINNTLKNTRGFKIIFWVDRNVKFYLYDTMAEFTTFENLGLSNDNKVEFKVIEEHYNILKVNNNYSAFIRESHGLYKNNAAASDILRYMILYHFGGMYLDMDVILSAQITELSIQSEYGFAVRLIDDDHERIIHNFIIATSINHPWIKLLLDDIEGSYYTQRPSSIEGNTISLEHNKMTWGEKRSNLFYKNGKSEKTPFPIRHEFTVQLTGSGLLFNVLDRNNLIPYVRELIPFFMKRPETTLSWVHV